MKKTCFKACYFSCKNNFFQERVPSVQSFCIGWINPSPSSESTARLVGEGEQPAVANLTLGEYVVFSSEHCNTRTFQ